MRTVRLNAVKDLGTGEIGLLIKGIRQISYPMVATDGLLVAHDLLEHQQGLKKIGGVGDELIALGGVLYVRGWTGQLRDRDMHPVEQHIAADVTELGRIHIQGRVPLREHVKSNRNNSVINNEVEEVLRISKKSLYSELSEENYKHIQGYLSNAGKLIKLGYSKASKRFRFKEEAYHMFNSIKDAVDKHIKYAGIYEGAEYKLSYDRHKATFDDVSYMY